MFYGTINIDRSGICYIDTSCACSNNFTVAQKDGGQDNNAAKYDFTYNEYMAQNPSFIATAMWAGAEEDAAFVEWWDSTPNITAVELTGQESRTGIPFSVFAPTGLSLVFDASLNRTLSFNPRIVEFDGGQVLTLTAKIRGLDSSTAAPGAGSSSTFKARLDKGASLLGIYEGGGEMTLSVPSSLTVNEQTWALTGWTFGGGAGEDGTQWKGTGGTSTYTLTLDSTSPMTTPQSFVIMATCDGQTLTTDPVVRLSNVPPAGLSM